MSTQIPAFSLSLIFPPSPAQPSYAHQFKSISAEQIGSTFMAALPIWLIDLDPERRLYFSYAFCEAMGCCLLAFSFCLFPCVICKSQNQWLL
jgi:hypothetical protein